jgi:hypothetical protein
MGGLLCGRPPFVSRAAVTPHGKTAEAPYSMCWFCNRLFN